MPRGTSMDGPAPAIMSPEGEQEGRPSMEMRFSIEGDRASLSLIPPVVKKPGKLFILR